MNNIISQLVVVTETEVHNVPDSRTEVAFVFYTTSEDGRACTRVGGMDSFCKSRTEVAFVFYMTSEDGRACVRVGSMDLFH